MLAPHITEALDLLQEECAETTVVVSKIRRFGIDTAYIINEESTATETKRSVLHQEIGDILCLVDLLVEYELLDASLLDTAKQRKREKLKKYSNLPNL